MQDIKKDLDFLKEMKSHFEDIEDTSQYEYGMNMINDWISELEEKLTSDNSDYAKSAPTCPYWHNGGICERPDKGDNCDGCED